MTTLALSTSTQCDSRILCITKKIKFMAKLYFSFSTMNAGKSTVLLQASHNYGERGMKTMLFTAELDNRSKVGNISSNRIK